MDGYKAVSVGEQKANKEGNPEVMTPRPLPEAQMCVHSSKVKEK